jgi:predicted polyphosphate/ATP-dependent NAD kinase
LALKKKLGFIINPIAGMGGRVGLKGTDSHEILQKAIKLAAKPVAPLRATETLNIVASIETSFDLLTYPFEMGADVARNCGLDPTVLGFIRSGRTTAADTHNAALELTESHVDLILFAGGDGTARDICQAVNQQVPVLGIPAGVKIHSGVFAVNPKKAGELTVKFLQGDTLLREAEVMDVDEVAFRDGRVSARLYGYLQIPYERAFIQQTKSGSATILSEQMSQALIAEYVAENMTSDYYYVLGPGTTVKAITDKLGVRKTLLGVDVVRKGKTVALDVNENQLLQLITRKKVKIIVSPIGGQGFIFGRGNQQISSLVIRAVGLKNIIVIATRNKLASIGFGRPLLVDTGDEELDKTLSRFIRVVTGYKEEVVVKVST